MSQIKLPVENLERMCYYLSQIQAESASQRQTFYPAREQFPNTEAVMTRLIFSGAAGLHIPSPNVLRFLERQVDFVVYEVSGFGQDLLFLDYREGQQTAVWRSGSALSQLSPEFERPSHLEIWEFGPQHLQIELHDTIQNKAPWQLSLIPAHAKVRPNRRAFYQRLPTTAVEPGAVITLERQRRATAVPKTNTLPAVPQFV